MNTLAAGNPQSHDFHADELPGHADELGGLRADRRGHERTSLAIRASVTVLGKSVLPATTIDLSNAGASITLPYELAPGQSCLIELELQACGVTGAFRIPAEVRYCVQLGQSRFRAGMRFGEMDAATAALIAAVLQPPHSGKARNAST